MQYYSTYHSPLGPFYLWFSDNQLFYASFSREGGEQFASKNRLGTSIPQLPLPDTFAEDLSAYFQGRRVEFDWPLLLLGTPFQLQVWEQIRRIPHGSFSTYKQIAQKLGSRAYRAVGQAVGANPVSIIVPCHRVLGTHGLGGYAGGLNVKRLLLELENVTLAPNLQA